MLHPGEVKSLVFSGKAPVDSSCTIKDSTHVFSEGDDIWDVMLNQVGLRGTPSCISCHKICSWLFKSCLLT